MPANRPRRCKSGSWTIFHYFNGNRERPETTRQGPAASGTAVNPQHTCDEQVYAARLKTSPSIRAERSHLSCGKKPVMEAGKCGEAMTCPAFSIIVNQLDSDLEDRKARSDALWADFLGWMKGHEITPDEARGLFRRLFEEYLE